MTDQTLVTNHLGEHVPKPTSPIFKTSTPVTLRDFTPTLHEFAIFVNVFYYEKYDRFYTVLVEFNTNNVINSRNGYQVGTYDPSTHTITFSDELTDTYPEAPSTFTLDVHTPYNIATTHDDFMSYRVYSFTIATFDITTDHIDGVIGRVHAKNFRISLEDSYINRPWTRGD